MRKLVASRTLPSSKRVAHTGPPEYASANATPTERSKVLLPDMFEPVTSSAELGPGKLTSLPTLT
jgi:hypothetical protein